MRANKYKNLNWDFKLPLSENQYKRFKFFKNYLKTNKSIEISEYWKKRETSFKIKKDKNFIYLKGLYEREDKKNFRRSLSFKETLKKYFDNKVNHFLKFLAGKKTYPPARLYKKSEYKNHMIEKYNQKYKREVKKYLGKFYNKFDEGIYAKLIDCIYCLKDNTKLTSKDSFLEIGPGNGTFAYLLIKKLKLKKAYLIDLPFMIPLLFFWLSALVGEQNVQLPGEKDNPNAIFILHLPSTFDTKNKNVSLAVNITSFQEMNHKLVNNYFKIITKSVKKNGYFLCVNRFEKTTNWWRYKWPKNSKTIINEEDLTSRTSFDMEKVIMRKLMKINKS